MVAILVDKWCCGNCELQQKGLCELTGLPISSSHLACNLMHNNFIDRGFTWHAPKKEVEDVRRKYSKNCL